MTERLVIAVPNGFRDVTRGPSRHSDWSKLADPSRRFLEKGCGLFYEGAENDPYYGFAKGFPIEFVEMRGQDIPEAVANPQSSIDQGIVGTDRSQNIFEDLLRQIEVVRPLPYGRCELKLGVPDDSSFLSSDSTLKDVTGLRVATGLEVLTKRIFRERGINAEIIYMTGHVETAIRYGIADVIVDITETGGTMIRNGITPAERLRSFHAALIGKKGPLDEGKEKIRDWLLSRMDIALANPNTWMSTKERQTRNGNGFPTPLLPLLPDMTQTPTVEGKILYQAS